MIMMRSPLKGLSVALWGAPQFYEPGEFTVFEKNTAKPTPNVNGDKKPSARNC